MFYIVSKLNRKIVSIHRTAATANKAEARFHAHNRRTMGPEQWVPAGVYEARDGFSKGLVLDEAQFKKDFRQICFEE